MGMSLTVGVCPFGRSTVTEPFILWQKRLGPGKKSFSHCTTAGWDEHGLNDGWMRDTYRESSHQAPSSSVIREWG